MEIAGDGGGSGGEARCVAAGEGQEASGHAGGGGGGARRVGIGDGNSRVAVPQQMGM